MDFPDGKRRRIPFLDHLGVELVSFGQGRSELAITVRPELCNSMRVAHGGVLFLEGSRDCKLRFLSGVSGGVSLMFRPAMSLAIELVGVNARSSGGGVPSQAFDWEATGGCLLLSLLRRVGAMYSSRPVCERALAIWGC